MAVLNYTSGEFMRSKKLTYIRQWTLGYSPFSKGMIGNVVEFVTMACRPVSWSVPTSDEEIAQWKRENWCLANDYYQCC
jgi:hypothetical protein